MIDRTDSPHSVDEAVRRTKEVLSTIEEEYKAAAFRPVLEFFLRRVEHNAKPWALRRLSS